MSYNGKTKYNFKDGLFTDLFENNPEALLELYNALNGTYYTDASKLEIVTIKDSLFVTMYNDVAFIFSGVISLYEHQSTLNKNMPLRMLCYIAEEYQRIAEQDPKSVYNSALIKLPTPRLIVFYNGGKKADDVTELRLSDAFINKDVVPGIELTVTMFNINRGHNQKLMESCRMLEEYSEFVYNVEKAGKMGTDSKRHINETIDYCIKNNILSKYLRERRSEVLGSLIREFDQEKYERGLREEGREEGRAEGRTEGQHAYISTLLKRFSPEKVAELLEIPLETVLDVTGDND